LGAGNFAMTSSIGRNSGFGYNALLNNSQGWANTATGDHSLELNTLGAYNTAVGTRSLENNTGGDLNTAVGSHSLIDNTVGIRNVAVGGNAGEASTGSNNIYLGVNVVGVAGESNAMYLGLQGLLTKTVIAGIRGITTGAADAVPVVIDSNGQMGTVSSSRRFKEDIHDMADMSRRLLQLRPVTFRYTQAYGDGSKPIQYGLVAEEVAEAFPELAVRDASGNVETVHYETLNVLLLNELQKEHAEVERQHSEIHEAQQRIDALEQRLDELVKARP
jgi:hypothetical protein